MTRSKIEWTDETWNPVTGCTKISPGCKNCYAQRMAMRLRGRCGYPQKNPFSVTLHPDKLGDPLHWKKPRKVFVCSMGDLFHSSVPYEYIEKVFYVMIMANNCIFQVLTKRAVEMLRFVEFFQDRANIDLSSVKNIWLGVSCENQDAANTRIPVLLNTPAAVRFISCEPLIGDIYLNEVENSSLSLIHI